MVEIMEAPKRGIRLPEVFITAVVMVIVAWAWNRLSDTFDASEKTRVQIEEGRAARNRELDDLKRHVNMLEEVLLKGCKS